MPPAVVPFDPTGEIAAVDRRAAERGAAADEFAARFGLEHGVSPVEVTGRRTVTITGRGAEPAVPRRVRDDRRPRAPRYERSGFRADRAAMWAVLLGLLLIFIAATSAHAATLTTLH